MFKHVLTIAKHDLTPTITTKCRPYSAVSETNFRSIHTISLGFCIKTKIIRQKFDCSDHEQTVVCKLSNRLCFECQSFDVFVTQLLEFMMISFCIFLLSKTVETSGMNSVVGDDGLSNKTQTFVCARDCTYV